MVRYPAAAARVIIDSFRMLEHDGLDAAPQRVVPDGHPELILNWSQPFEALQGGRWEYQPRCFLVRFHSMVRRECLQRPCMN